MFGKVGFSHGAQIACFRFQFSLMCCHNTKACRRIIEVKFPELVSPPKVVNEEFNDSLNLPGACSLRFILRAHDVYERQSFYHRIGDNIFNQSKRHIFKHPSTQNDSTMAKPKKCWWMRKMTGSNVTNNQHYVRCLGRYPSIVHNPLVGAYSTSRNEIDKGTFLSLLSASIVVKKSNSTSYSVKSLTHHLLASIVRISPFYRFSFGCSCCTQ